MKNAKFDLYDIDGTLTKPGYDLWFECAKIVVKDKETFYTDVHTWKKERNNQEVINNSSLKMMHKSIRNTPNNFTGKDWYECTKHIVIKLINQNKIFLPSIVFLKNRLAKKITAVLSTTNIIDGAFGFLSALVDKKLLCKQEIKNIIVSGTEVDWKNKEIVHFNIAEKKITGFSRKTGIPIDHISNQVLAAFGDDPLGNDKGILSIAKYPFIIRNKKNEKLIFNKSFKLIEWDSFDNFDIGR